MTDHGRSAAVAASGLRPSGAEPQDASQAKPLVPNAEAVVEMAAVLLGNVASQRITDAAHINFRELAIVAILHVHSSALEHLRQCTECSVGSRSDFNQGVTRGLEIATAQIEYGHYLASGTEAHSGETEGLDPKGDGPTLEEGDAQ